MLVLLVLCGVPVRGQDRADAPAAQPVRPAAILLEGIPIDRGYVVIDGQYIAPPYRVGQIGDRLTINGKPVLMVYSDGSMRFDREGWRDFWRDEDRPGQGRSDEVGRSSDRAGDDDYEQRRYYRSGWSSPEWVERRLTDRYLLVIATDRGMATIPSMTIPRYLEVMALDLPIGEKIEELNKVVDRPVFSAIWQSIIEDYRPQPELLAVGEQIEQDLAQRRQVQAEREAGARLHLMAPLVAIAAVLVAIGVLLRTHRAGFFDPPEHRLWRHVDPSGKRSRLVMQLIAVLVLLNGLDLLFTLLAQRTGQFVELSPVGDRLITNPVALGFYKTTLVAVGAGILLMLRKRRAAEVTAWWLCALYILVLVRWAAVNTLLVA